MESAKYTIDELLDRARARFERVTPERLESEMAGGAIVVDIRSQAQRDRDGEIAGALVYERNVLEWRLAPSSEFKEVDVAGDRKVIVVCNEGYQSSLAAAVLQDLGVRGATDLAGGYQAYRRVRGGD
jgi:rhodanese-related sulfurtransferase